MGKEEMVTMSFRVKPEEARLIERHVKTEKTTVSRYVRTAVLFDMAMEGDWEAFKHIATEVRAEVLKRMSRRFGFRRDQTTTTADPA